MRYEAEGLAAEFIAKRRDGAKAENEARRTGRKRRKQRAKKESKSRVDTDVEGIDKNRRGPEYRAVFMRLKRTRRSKGS